MIVSFCLIVLLLIVERILVQSWKIQKLGQSHIKRSAILCSVLTRGFLVSPRMMLSSVDCFTLPMVANLLMLMPRVLHKEQIRST